MEFEESDDNDWCDECNNPIDACTCDEDEDE